MAELSDSERALLAREVAADGYEPSMVADSSDILRVPRDAFVAGWDAAMAYSTPDDSEDVPVAVLDGPTRWKDFVNTLELRPSADD